MNSDLRFAPPIYFNFSSRARKSNLHETFFREIAMNPEHFCPRDNFPTFFPLTHYRFISTSLPCPRTRFHTLILRGKNTGQNSWSDNFPRMTARPGMREIRAQNFSLSLWLPIIFRSCTVILCVLIGELCNPLICSLTSVWLVAQTHRQKWANYEYMLIINCLDHIRSKFPRLVNWPIGWKRYRNIFENWEAWNFFPRACLNDFLEKY